MKKILAVLILLAMLPGCGLSEINVEQQAEQILTWLADGEFQSAYDASDENMQAALVNADGLKATWDQLSVILGDYQGIADIVRQAQGEYEIAVVTCDFSLTESVLYVVFDAKGAMAGLQLASYEYKQTDKPAMDDIIEEEILLRAGSADETKGMLTLPEGDGPFPCVILVQGTGATDMNETAYGLPLFQEISHGLAQRGVASIRYDKYTYAHEDLLTQDAEALRRFTVYEEYIQDAQAACALLDGDKRISEIFVLGHSAGAMLTPRILSMLDSEKVAGGILIAGTPKTLMDVIVRQYQDSMAGADEETAEKMRQELQIAQETFSAMEQMTDEQRMDLNIFGASGYYLYEEASVDAAALAREQGYPLLIAQGAKDFQVPVDMGMDAWKDALSGMDNVEYKLYANMNHLLYDMEADSTGTIMDYENAAEQHVSSALLDDIKAWICAQ